MRTEAQNQLMVLLRGFVAALYALGIVALTVRLRNSSRGGAVSRRDSRRRLVREIWELLFLRTYFGEWRPTALRTAAEQARDGYVSKGPKFGARV